VEAVKLSRMFSLRPQPDIRLQTKLQTNHAAQDGTGHNKVRSSEEKCRTGAHA